jgi:glycosyltransferase involved in cell wall biosynthesis
MTPSPPLISVTMPVWNGARHLAAAIESVLAQSYRPLQLIVVDDGSTDESAEIAARYESEGVTVLRQDNQGTAAARNRGLAAARGELLAHLDADDVWPVRSLESRAAALAADPRADVAHGWVEEFYSDELDAGERQRLREPRRPLAGHLIQSLLMRRPAQERVGWFDATLRAGQDLDWLLRAREAALRFVEIPEVVVRRRLHATNKGRRQPELARQRCRILKAALDRRRAAAAAGGEP